jgi:hypothetical protein
MQPDNAYAWGALAIDKKHSDAWGVSSNYSTSLEAETVALSKCGQDNCKLVRLFFNECVAYAVDRKAGSNIIGESGGCATREYAERRALDQCISRGGADCVVRAWGCDISSKKEEQRTTAKNRGLIRHTFDSAYGKYFISLWFNVITVRIDYEEKWFEIRTIYIDSIDRNTLSHPRGSRADIYTIYAKTKMPYEYITYGQGQVVKNEDNEMNLNFNDEEIMIRVWNILSGK